MGHYFSERSFDCFQFIFLTMLNFFLFKLFSSAELYLQDREITGLRISWLIYSAKLLSKRITPNHTTNTLVSEPSQQTFVVVFVV